LLFGLCFFHASVQVCGALLLSPISLLLVACLPTCWPKH
jgi:hypothetical protein